MASIPEEFATARTREKIAQAKQYDWNDPAQSSEYFAGVARVEDQIAETTSWYFIQTAEKLYLPTPDYTDGKIWVRSRRTGASHLTEAAMSALNTAIRNERKERLQLWELRAKIIGAAVAGATGFVGVLIGLIAILKK